MPRARAVAVVLCAVVIGATSCTRDDPTGPPSGPGIPTASLSASVPSPAQPPTSTTPVETPSEASTDPTPKPSTPAPVSQKNPGWPLDRLDQRRRPLDKLFTTTGQGQGVTIYVVDGLFDVTNAEFGGRAAVGLKKGKPCVLEDGINHGLFVAGLAAGRRTGVAQRADVVLVGSSGGCEGSEEESRPDQIARIVRALDWIVDHGERPGVVNLSLNADGPAPELSAGVAELVAAGFTVVASAGNEGDDACDHPPAGLPSVITVAASTTKDRDAGLNHGDCVDLFAPGEGVTSVVDPGLSPDRLATSDFAATSWAAPLVSGAAALYLSAHPDAAPAEVRTALIDTATTEAMRGSLHGSPDRLLYVGAP